MQKLFWIGVAGAAGTLMRYVVAGTVQRVSGSSFPWGTVGVNLAGAFLFGVVWSLGEERLVISSQLRTIVLTGFMGAFTTFSTFMFETNGLLHDAQWGFATGNVVLQTILGLALLFVGLAVGRAF